MQIKPGTLGVTIGLAALAGATINAASAEKKRKEERTNEERLKMREELREIKRNQIELEQNLRHRKE